MEEMILPFSKPLESLSKEDVEILITEGITESYQVEFKERLPSKNDIDPWEKGEDRIGDKARNEVLEEIVAFANAHGGHLFLGIAETENRPARASKIVSIPRCIDLAEKLRLQARDCIEPKIPILNAVGVVTDEQGGGVIVFRIPQSRLAPHRLIPTKDCYIRRNDRSEKMTMIEIQDLTLQTERGMEKVNRYFEEQRNNFLKRIDAIIRKDESAFGVRATLVPIFADIYIQKVFNNRDLHISLRDFKANWSNSKIPLHFPFGGRIRPILRGVDRVEEWERGQFHCEVFCNGVISYSLCLIPKHQHDYLSTSWVLSIISNAILTANEFRKKAGAPDVEYGLEVEINKPNGQLGLQGFNDRSGDRVGLIETNPLIFPRYTIGSPDEFQNITDTIFKDLWNALGQDSERSFLVDFFGS